MSGLSVSELQAESQLDLEVNSFVDREGKLQVRPATMVHACVGLPE